MTESEIEIITSLIKIQEELLKIAKELPEATERELVIKNRRIKLITTEISRLKKLGIEERKQLDLDKIRNQIIQVRIKNIEEEIDRVRFAELVKFDLKKRALAKEKAELIKAGGDKIEIDRLFNRLREELEIEHARTLAEQRKAIIIKNEED